MTAPILVAVLLVSLIAVARMTRLLVTDKITEFIRLAAVNRFGKESLLTFGLFCGWCVSIWVGAAFGAILWWATPVGPELSAEGVDWWIGLPLYVLVSSWVTGMSYRLEE